MSQNHNFRESLKIHKINYFSTQNLVGFFRQQKGGFRVSRNSTHKIGDLFIFTFPQSKQYSSQIFNIPNLNSMQEWNDQYFYRLLQSMNNIMIIDQEQIDPQTQEVVVSKSAVVRDKFCEDQIYLLRCKLIQQYARKPTDDLWKYFEQYNKCKSKQQENLNRQIQNLRFQKNKKIKALNNTLEEKQHQKNQVKGKLSALLRQKKMKLKEYGEQFTYKQQEYDQESSKLDFSGSQEDKVFVGSLFESSSQPYMAD